MKKVILTPEEVREFHEHDRWVKNIMNGCENMRDSKLVSIPVSLSHCSVIDDVCRFDVCPKQKMTKCKGCGTEMTKKDFHILQGFCVKCQHKADMERRQQKRG